MSEAWIKRNFGTTEIPACLKEDQMVEYQLVGDDRVYTEYAWMISWDDHADDGGQGAVRHFRPLSSYVPTQVGVGDVTSNARGSGARFNAGKPALELIPASIFAEYRRIKQKRAPAPFSPSLIDARIFDALRSIEAFQMRETGQDYRECLLDALNALDFDGRIWADCARVFDYGREKYAAWNWAKGMAWGIPIGCALRHIVFGLLVGESIDPESGLPHRGHIACNIVMLLWFMDEYPEGDDRPSIFSA
jgi:hypothetical protein